jgi:hypothetical protein
MEASQHSLLAACFTLHSINATLAIVPQRGAGLWIRMKEIAKRMKETEENGGREGQTKEGRKKKCMKGDASFYKISFFNLALYISSI